MNGLPTLPTRISERPDALDPPEGSMPETLYVVARPAAGKHLQWEATLEELISASRQFPGHQASIVLKPALTGLGDYRVITRFDSSENLHRWHDSPERQRWVERLVALQAEPPLIDRVPGWETWFDLSEITTDSEPAAPPKYKMFVVIWIAVYGTVLPLIAFLRPWTDGLPRLLSSAVLAASSVALMTWVVMPLLTRMFRFWLHPATVTTACRSDR